jgi:hypothetical protein
LTFLRLATADWFLTFALFAPRFSTLASSPFQPV